MTYNVFDGTLNFTQLERCGKAQGETNCLVLVVLILVFVIHVYYC